ncbi:MAG: hypothetical protein ACRD40_13825 [Candidatus Acidiferrales bacterium]
MRRRPLLALAYIATFVILTALVWMNRYSYRGENGFIRINRFTGRVCIWRQGWDCPLKFTADRVMADPVFQRASKDPEFQKLDSADKRAVLYRISPGFAQLSNSDQDYVVSRVKGSARTIVVGPSEIEDAPKGDSQ